MPSFSPLLDSLGDGTPPPPLPAGPHADVPMAPTPNAAAEQPTAQAPHQATEPTLPEDLQDALRELVRGYELEADDVRRSKVRKWREGEEFWRGNQNIWYSESDAHWHSPFEREDLRRDEQPRYDYTLNLYRPWGLSIIAALTQAPPTIQYLPVSADSQEDIATARAATRIAQLVARNNNLATLRVKKGYFLWTQGVFATYVRYLVDGGQFGYHPEPVLGERVFEVLPDRFECPDCGHYQPASESSGLIAGGPVGCRGCGSLLGPTAFQSAVHVTTQAPIGTRQAPNGAEKLDAYGPLFFKVPPEAQSQRDCYYLIQVEELHQSVLRAAYPQFADKIGHGSAAEDNYERIARLALADGGDGILSATSLVTYKRCWLRPEAFWSHADEHVRAQLLALFPDGCRVEFAGGAFLHAVAERMDDCWVICPGQPGPGIYRDPLGADALSIQRQINDNANLLAEHRELSSAPPILYDASYINGEAIAAKRMQPGSYVPVHRAQGHANQHPLSDLIYQPRLNIDPQLWGEGARLAELGQFVTGALPSMFGGGVPNLSTAAAYAQSRDQAMGRLLLIWKQMREAEAREMTLGIECFRRNRSDDVELVVEGSTGGFRSEYIRLAELRGNVIARPTADEDFPQSFSQVREALGSLLQTKDPDLLEVLGASVNRPLIQHYLGLPDLIDPGEDNRVKQFYEIEALSATEPIRLPDGYLAPSIAPDLHVDDHAIHIATIREWAVTEAGLKVKVAHPLGYQNIIAHLVAHQAAAAATTPTQRN